MGRGRCWWGDGGSGGRLKLPLGGAVPKYSHLFTGAVFQCCSPKVLWEYNNCKGGILAIVFKNATKKLRKTTD